MSCALQRASHAETRSRDRKRPRLPTTIIELVAENAAKLTAFSHTGMAAVLCIFAGGYAFSPLDEALPARALLRLPNHSGSGLAGRWLRVQQPS